MTEKQGGGVYGSGATGNLSAPAAGVSRLGAQSPIQKQVIEFHQVSDHPIASSPTQITPNRVRLRADLILEEAFEALRALMGDNPIARARLTYFEDETRTTITAAVLKTVDLVELGDGLADLDYVVEGTRLEFGIDGDPIAREVHRSNMAKAVACDVCRGNGVNEFGNRCYRCSGKGRTLLKREDGKTLKPSGWTPPDIAGELAKQQADPVAHGLAGRIVDVRDYPSRG